MEAAQLRVFDCFTGEGIIRHTHGTGIQPLVIAMIQAGIRDDNQTFQDLMHQVVARCNDYYKLRIPPPTPEDVDEVFKRMMGANA